MLVMAGLLLVGSPVFAQKHEYVDLGLPSGTLWATCNVGADAPEEYGDYFAWGETTSKSTYKWSNYKYCVDDGENLTKYCSRSYYGFGGFTDDLKTLQPDDDAATANWGDEWCTPTYVQWVELYQHTTRRWMTRKGVYGMLFTSSNGRSLFMPAAGYYGYDGLSYAGRHGRYWSSSLNANTPGYASSSYFNKLTDHTYQMVDCDRVDGYSVRPVRSTRQN